MNKKYSIPGALFFILPMFFLLLTGCGDHDDEPVRSEDDILGVWMTPSQQQYIDVDPQNRAYHLFVTEQGGEYIGRWSLDGFFYEPGYNLVISMSEDLEATVYKVIELTDKELVWCPVDYLNQEFTDGKNIGEIILHVLEQAQEGYDTDPELYQYFIKITEDEFFHTLEQLNIIFPWF